MSDELTKQERKQISAIEMDWARAFNAPSIALRVLAKSRASSRITETTTLLVLGINFGVWVGLLDDAMRPYGWWLPVLVGVALYCACVGIAHLREMIR